MDAHFRAFSFVDRINPAQDGKRIAGTFAIPAELKDFPLALVGEAVGQLAAWAAMAELQFEHRPVAGLAGSIELYRLPRAGGVLELAAELEQVDTSSVAYGGTAHLDGELVMRLQDCVGPMVPLADFDDPIAVRRQFDLLCGRGAEPGRFAGLPSLRFNQICKEAAQSASGSFQVPPVAEFFKDHFPRRAVFPGSLLMHLSLQLGAALAAELPQPDGSRWAASEVQDLKLRAFIPPGESLCFHARLKQVGADRVSMALDTRVGNDIIATAGLLLRAKEEQ
jgi:3-hydroxymyristoyl/3-hydroxydecanoyl-(acyl carrier protein) dehydratase